MKKPRSFPGPTEPGAPPKPPSAEESLDFTPVKPAKPAARTRPESADRDKAGRSRRGVVLALIVIAVAIGVVVVVSQDSSPPPVTSEATPAPAPPEIQTAPESPSKPPLPATRSQPQGSAPHSVDARPIPAEFLKRYEEYAARPSGGKAIALALDADGGWAYGTVSGVAAQSDADEEALSECARYQKETGVQENCRLFASGDKRVW